MVPVDAPHSQHAYRQVVMMPAAAPAPDPRFGGGGGGGMHGLPMQAPLPDPIGSHEMQVRFVRIYFLYANALLPMVCKSNFYVTGLRFHKYDLIASLCERTRPVCDHRGGDCAALTFVPLAATSEEEEEEEEEEDGGADSMAGSLLRLRSSGAPASAAGQKAGSVPSRSSASSAAASAATSGSSGNSSSGTASSGGGSTRFVPMPLGYVRASDELIAAHMRLLPPTVALSGMAADSPKVVMATISCLCGMLAIGARLDMNHGLADLYASRVRDTLSHCFDVPCGETLSALLLAAYYACGTCTTGDFSRAKMYVALAAEMVGVLDAGPAAARRRAATSAFSGDRDRDRDRAAASSAPIPGGGLSLSALPPLDAAASAAAFIPTERSAAGGGTSSSRSTSRASGSTASQGDAPTHSSSSAALGEPPADSQPADSQPASGAWLPRPVAEGEPDDCGGAPPDLVHAVGLLAAITGAVTSHQHGPTSAASSAAGAPLPPPPAPGALVNGAWVSPRGKVYHLLAYVTHATRHSVTPPARMPAVAAGLLAALDEAEALVTQHRLGGQLDFCAHVVLHAQRAVILHGSGDTPAALAQVDRALGALERTPLRAYTGFMPAALLVQLVPVCVAGGRPASVAAILGYLQEQARMWPVCGVLLAKARRRIGYSARRAAAVRPAAAPASASVFDDAGSLAGEGASVWDGLEGMGAFDPALLSLGSATPTLQHGGVSGAGHAMLRQAAFGEGARDDASLPGTPRGNGWSVGTLTPTPGWPVPGGPGAAGAGPLVGDLPGMLQPGAFIHHGHTQIVGAASMGWPPMQQQHHHHQQQQQQQQAGAHGGIAGTTAWYGDGSAGGAPGRSAFGPGPAAAAGGLPSGL
jgi:hypothetical protein